MATAESLLQPPSTTEFSAPSRPHSSYASLNTFELPKASARKYSTQYADLYFVRLALLKRHVEAVATAAWKDAEVAGEKARKVDRVLDVRQGELCWVIGTIFMEMSLKPNILDDLEKEHWIVAPAPRDKFIKNDGSDEVMVEDESGRLKLAGSHLISLFLCTGCIVAILGTENSDGAFEVADIKFPDLPPQPERWTLVQASANRHSANGTNAQANGAQRTRGKIAIVSGLGISGVTGDTLLLEMLSEYLLGEAGNSDEAQQISRLIIAGNSLTGASPIPTREETSSRKKNTKKYGIDPVEYNATPPQELDRFLSTLLPSIPITLMAGETDPANVSVPQQPLHAALFPHSRNYMRAHDDESGTPSWFDSVTNPWEGEIDGWRVLGTGGQPVNDMYKYTNADNRLRMMEHFLRWRNAAPTAPDTLCESCGPVFLKCFDLTG
jgi:DNA polymerase delta subunit 2